MSEFKSSQTYMNLANAFAGESQARNRYTFFAAEALKSGYNQISRLFLETADNEKEHALIFYKHLVENLGADAPSSITVTGDFPIEFGGTSENLLSAAKGEEEEVEAYFAMADTAELEGFQAVARSFRAIAAVETHHGIRFQRLLDNVVNDQVFAKDETTQWICKTCGYIHTGPRAPELCPACLLPKSHFELHAEPY